MIVIRGSRGQAAVSLSEALSLTELHDECTGHVVEDEAYVAYCIECEDYSAVNRLVGEVLWAGSVDDEEYFLGKTCFRAHVDLPSLVTQHLQEGAG